MAVWPATLPQEPIPDSLTETPPNLLARTEMDAGPAKVRRRYTAGVTDYAMEYVFTPEEMLIWEGFYNAIGFGVTPFDFPDPRKYWETITVRLVEPPSYKHLGAGYYSVSMKMEKLP